MPIETSPPRRREDILAAASELFTVQGYAATSMSDIRRASGASTGSLYHHFPSREHLAAALWQASLADFQAGFRQALESAPRAKRGVVDSVLFHAGWIEDHPDRARFLLAQREPRVVELCAADFQDRNRAFFDAVLGWHRSHVAAGALRPVPADALPAVWIGPAQEHGRAWLEQRSMEPPRSVAPALADAVWRALRQERRR